MYISVLYMTQMVHASQKKELEDWIKIKKIQEAENMNEKEDQGGLCCCLFSGYLFPFVG